MNNFMHARKAENYFDVVKSSDLNFRKLPLQAKGCTTTKLQKFQKSFLKLLVYFILISNRKSPTQFAEVRG